MYLKKIVVVSEWCVQAASWRAARSPRSSLSYLPRLTRGSSTFSTTIIRLSDEIGYLKKQASIYKEWENARQAWSTIKIQYESRTSTRFTSHCKVRISVKVRIKVKVHYVGPIRVAEFNRFPGVVNPLRHATMLSERYCNKTFTNGRNVEIHAAIASAIQTVDLSRETTILSLI